jgi:hypothetical protein
MATVPLALLPVCNTELDVCPLLQFPANSILPTRAASSATWERTAHWVCSSCKRNLDHVRTCLGI